MRDASPPENSPIGSPVPSDPPVSSRTLAIFAMFAGSLTLAWVTFLAWLVFKGVSLF